MYAAVKIADDKCIGCKLCISTCPDPNVLKFLKESKKIIVSDDRCKGCGLCVAICPKKAMSMAAA
ncbi:MAG: 4Fe-4S binding protein [Desulfotomaculum sp.]|nr:4Fe-4S binding protein [Desulfotomaculum sp.]